MNLCPCGYVSDFKHQCGCSEERIARYSRKLSGLLLDRIDLIIGVLALSQTELLQGEDDAPNWGQLRERIQRCRQLQIDRAGRLNADLLLAQIQACCPMGDEQRRQLAATMDKLSMSARATHRVIKMARTIADY